MSAEESEVLEFGGLSQRKPHGRDQIPIHGVVTGTLIGFADAGRTPLVSHARQADSGALAAATIVDLHGAHIGRKVILQFADGDVRRPIVMGLLRDGQGPAALQPGQVEVDVDGERMIVSAKQQLVLKCGKASITLTKAGKVLIEGAYVSSRSAGMNRIKGGSVQIN